LKSSDDKNWLKNLNQRARYEYESSILMDFNHKEGPQCRSSSHEIVVGFDNDGTPYLYDNARNTRRPVNDVEVFVNSLVYYWGWYAFSIALK
jgi:hypothetical protein